MNDKDIYELKLHESTNVGNGRYMVLRVAGGWIYTHYLQEIGNHTSCFVPIPGKLNV